MCGNQTYPSTILPLQMDTNNFNYSKLIDPNFIWPIQTFRFDLIDMTVTLFNVVKLWS